MYRDNFKPSSSNERNEPEKPVEKPIVKVVEKIVEAKQEPVLKFEPRDASPDTDAACSVTISDKDPTSPDSEIPPRAMDIDPDMSKTDDSKETGDEDDKNVVDEAPPSPVEHPVIVKKVVEEIESRAKDYTDGSSTPSPVKTQTFPLETNDDEVTVDEETIEDDKVEINEPAVEIKDNAPLESSIKTERNVETASAATIVDIQDQTEQDVAETPDEVKSEDKSTADIVVDHKDLGKGSVEDRTDETHTETVSKDVKPNMNQSSTILSSPGVTSPVDVLGTDLSDTVIDKSVESESESHVKANVLEEKRTEENEITDDKSENVDQPKIEPQLTDLASESIPKPNEIDAGSSNEVDEKTEDKVLETVVLSEQVEKDIIEEPTVLETSPTKESPVEPISGTNVDAKPDSLEIKSSIEPDVIDEVVDKTEDKVEETVVLSEQEEKQIIQEPAVVETSPAKESPVKPISGTNVDAKPDSLEIKSCIEPSVTDEVVDKTEDKVEETVVSSEQEKTEIIQESAGEETTPTKESPEKPIPGTNVDAKPDSLEIKSSIEPDTIDEVVDKTEDKLEETVVSSEQEKTEIIQESAGEETTPTKESPEKPIPGTNVDAKPDSLEIKSSIEPELIDEVIDKTEDKLEETVVLSEQEEKQIFQEPAVVETSPTKESPVEPVPGTNVDAESDTMAIPSNIEPELKHEVIENGSLKDSANEQPNTETQEEAPSELQPNDAKPVELPVESNENSEKDVLIKETNVMQTSVYQESDNQTIEKQGINVALGTEQHTELASESTSKLDGTDTGAGHEVVDKTEDKEVETVVLSEQVEKQILQEPAVVETSPAKESQDEPIPSTNIGAEPDSLEIESSTEPEINDQVVDNATVEDSANGQQNTVTQKETSSEIQTKDTQSVALPVQSTENVEKDVLIKETNVMQTSVYAESDNQTIEKQEISVALETATALIDDICEPGNIENEPPKTEESVDVKDTDKTADNNPETMQEANAQSPAVVDQKTESTNETVEEQIKTEPENYQDTKEEPIENKDVESNASEQSVIAFTKDKHESNIEIVEKAEEVSESSKDSTAHDLVAEKESITDEIVSADIARDIPLESSNLEQAQTDDIKEETIISSSTPPSTPITESAKTEEQESETSETKDLKNESFEDQSKTHHAKVVSFESDVLKEQPVHEAELKSSPKESTENADNEIKVGQTNEQAMSVEETTVIETKSDTVENNVNTTETHEVHTKSMADIMQQSMHEDLQETVSVINGDNTHDDNESNAEETDDANDNTKTADEPKTKEDVTVNGVKDDTPETNDNQAKLDEEERFKALIKGNDTQMSMKMMRGEVSAKTTYQRTSTGPIAISEVSPEGKFIMLENTSSGPNRKDVNLDGWKLRRTVDGKRDYSYNFRNFTLKAGKKVKILARGSAAEAGLNDLVFREEDNWGVGSQVTTALINDKNEDKASHVQKTLYN
ncbi:protein P200-like isoform X2 [Mya arenaria]|uniref:protein P200-like isoform X2 n=1 Tax=Mya arenaria TaxID=6604 RepID=UPI0022E08DAF|nr:protein P200-like isoform X2 [Mya arenaria]